MAKDSPTMESSSPGFTFKKRLERVDWRKIAAIDVDSISRNLDFNVLQENIQHITFCNIEAELDMQTVDPSFVKLFRLAQLTIEYLLHSQDYLSEAASTLEQKLNTALKEHEETMATLKATNEELSETKKECHRRKKMLATQQQLIHAGASAYNKCEYCTKAFINTSFLQAHISRRHSHQHPLQPSSPVARMAQSVQAATTPTAGGGVALSSTSLLENELRTIKAQLVEERDVRIQEIEASKRERDVLLEKMNMQFSAWKKEQVLVQNEAVDQFKSMYNSQLQELEAKNKSAQAMQAALNRKIGGSNLGNLEDCGEERVRQKRDAEKAKEMLQAQVCKLESDMQARFQEQERHWSEKMRAMSISHQHKLQAVQNSQQTVPDVKQITGEPSPRGQQQKLKERNLSVKKQACQQHLEVTQQDNKKSKRSPEMKRKSGGLKSVFKSPRHQAFMKKDKSETDKENQSPAYLTSTQKHGESTPVIPIMSLNSEDDDEDDSTEFDPTSTFGTATLPTLGTETLSWHETKNSRLLDQMKRNPNFLPAMKTRIKTLLDEELERRGIPPGLTHINNAVYESKLMLLNKERQQRAMHFKRFYDIRQQYLNDLDQRLRQTNNSNIATASRNNDVVHSASLPRMTQPANRPAIQPAEHAGTIPRMPPPQRPVPQPAPRSTSPPSAPVTAQSNHWTSESYTEEDEDESEDDDDDDDEAYDNHVDYPVTQIQQVTNRTDAGDAGSDSEWDSGSELREMKGVPTPWNGAATYGANTNQNAAIHVREPRGKMVAALSKSIGYQLQSRSGKKLLGAINTLTGDDQLTASNGRVSRNSTESIDDKDLFTVSSEDDSVDMTDHKLRHPSNIRNGHPETDTSTRTSTNTLATSGWGSSRVHQPVGGASVGKSSLASVSDWDNVEDI